VTFFVLELVKKQWTHDMFYAVYFYKSANINNSGIIIE